MFIHCFFGSARNAALRKLLPASRSLLLFPPLFRTAWFPPPAPTDLSHGFSTILAKHKTDQTEPPKHNTHLVFFDWFDTARWWGMSCAFDFLRNYWFRCFLRRVMVIFRQQKNFGPNVIYLDMPQGGDSPLPPPRVFPEARRPDTGSAARGTSGRRFLICICT